MPKFTIFMAKKDELLNPETPVTGAPIASSPAPGTRLPDNSRAGTNPHGSRPGDRQHPARAQQRPGGAADVRRRHNPSSRFRG